MYNLQKYRDAVAKVNEVFNCGNCHGEYCGSCQKWDDIRFLKEQYLK